MTSLIQTTFKDLQWLGSWSMLNYSSDDEYCISHLSALTFLYQPACKLIKMLILPGKKLTVSFNQSKCSGWAMARQSRTIRAFSDVALWCQITLLKNPLCTSIFFQQNMKQRVPCPHHACWIVNQWFPGGAALQWSYQIDKSGQIQDPLQPPASY